MGGMGMGDSSGNEAIRCACKERKIREEVPFKVEASRKLIAESGRSWKRSSLDRGGKKARRGSRVSGIKGGFRVENKGSEISEGEARETSINPLPKGRESGAATFTKFRWRKAYQERKG